MEPNRILQYAAFAEAGRNRTDYQRACREKPSVARVSAADGFFPYWSYCNARFDVDYMT